MFGLDAIERFKSANLKKIKLIHESVFSLYEKNTETHLCGIY